MKRIILAAILLPSAAAFGEPLKEGCYTLSSGGKDLGIACISGMQQQGAYVATGENFNSIKFCSQASKITLEGDTTTFLLNTDFGQIPMLFTGDEKAGVMIFAASILRYTRIDGVTAAQMALALSSEECKQAK